MRMRQVVMVGALAMALGLGPARVARACRVCDQFLQCCDQTPGAKLCIQNSYSCSMLLACEGGNGNRIPDAPSDDLTAWSLFDAVGTPTASVQVDVGPLAWGAEARARGASAAAAGSLADVALAFGDAFAVSLVNDAGDGFALARSVEGSRVRLEVRDVVNERPGRVLASALLAPRDQLIVPVRVAGRDRVLLLQTERVRGAVAAEIARARQALHEAGRWLPVPAEPLLRAQPQ